MGKGIKTCGSCGKGCGPRTISCSCGVRFVFKAKSKNHVRTKGLEDWRELKKDQRIKSVQGYGPYFVGEDGERQNMGYYGVFKVRSVQSDGILAVSDKGFVFLYMGKTQDSKVAGVREAHRLELVKQ